MVLGSTRTCPLLLCRLCRHEDLLYRIEGVNFLILVFGVEMLIACRMVLILDETIVIVLSLVRIAAVGSLIVVALLLLIVAQKVLIDPLVSNWDAVAESLTGIQGTRRSQLLSGKVYKVLSRYPSVLALKVTIIAIREGVKAVFLKSQRNA